MPRVEQIANQMAVQIANELQLDNDKKAVMAYGIFAFIHMFLCIIAVIIVGAIFGVVFEAVLISLTISVFRKSSGGAHASKPWICNLEGTVISVVPAIILRGIDSYLHSGWVFVMGIMAFGWAYYLTFKLAPIDSPAKPIKKQATRKRLKKGSILILSVYGVIVLANIVLFYLIKNNRFLVYCFCIYIGVIWQAFTLTKTGHLLLNQIDIFLNTIFKKGE